LPPVRLRDVHPPRRLRSVRSLMQSCVQVSKIVFETDAVLRCPCGTAAGRGVRGGGLAGGACERGGSRRAAVAFGNSA
jgi:hypothetical protein